MEKIVRGSSNIIFGGTALSVIVEEGIDIEGVGQILGYGIDNFFANCKLFQLASMLFRG